MSTEDKRQAFIDGLHQIADFLAEHPEVPLPYLGNSVTLGINTPSLPIYLVAKDGTQRDAIATIARAMGKAEKLTDGDPGARFYVWRKFAGIALVASADRDEVCERVVTGTREVTREVPDPEALAAVPKVTVTEIVEDVTWECGPLLKAAPKGLISL